MKLEYHIEGQGPLKSFSEDFEGLDLFSKGENNAAAELLRKSQRLALKDKIVLVKRSIIEERMVFDVVESFNDSDELRVYIADNYMKLQQELIVVNLATQEYQKKIVTSSNFYNSLN